MDLWKLMDLTPKTLRDFAENKEVLKRKFQVKETVELFFNRFPFEKLLNITTIDSCSSSLSVEILDLLSDYDEFYSYEDPFNSSIEFILINLSQITKDCKEIWSLFEFLTKILKRNKNAINTCFKNVFDQERILKVMLKVARFELENESSLLCYGSIINDLLELNFPDSVNYLIACLFETLKNHNILAVMIVISRHILNKCKLLCDIFKNVCEWLTQECPLILNENNPTELLIATLQCLVMLTNYNPLKIIIKSETSKLTEYSNNLYKTLIKMTSAICVLSSNQELRSNCFQLLEFILLNFFEKEKLICKKFQITKELQMLPTDIEQWPQYDTDMFFSVCHIAISYSKMVWKKDDVLKSIIRCFLIHRHLLKIYTLKSIYFLFPELIYHDSDDNIDPDLLTVGDDLLNFFLKFSRISRLYSYNADQLKWMMSRGSKALKMNALSQWINTIKNEEILATVIQQCKAEPIILQLILDQTLEPKLCSKAASLLRKTTTLEFSRRIALILPLIVDKPKIFNNLILAQPAVPVDSKEDSKLICSLMGAVLPTLSDSEVLKGACVFSSKLLANLKNEPDVIALFCKNMANIGYLMKITTKVDEATTIEIIRLLKVIIAIQKRNRVVFKTTLKHDFKALLKGSTEKIEKSLKLLYHIMSYKHSLIAIDNNDFLNIYYTLLNFDDNVVLQSLVYECIVLLLKRMPTLATTLNTSVHLEMTCLATTAITNKRHVANLLKLVEIWLRILLREPQNGFCPVPEPGLRNFIMRAPLNRFKAQEFITILNEITKRESV